MYIIYSVLLELSVKWDFWDRLAHKFVKISSAAQSYHVWVDSLVFVLPESLRFVYTYKVTFSKFWPIAHKKMFSNQNTHFIWEV